MAMCVRALAVALALFAGRVYAEVDVELAALDDACLADGSNADECGLSLRQLRGERKTAEIQQHNSSAGGSSGFCCYGGVSKGKMCSTCMPTAMAVADTYCASADTCGGCGGTWCTARCVYSGENPNDVCGTAFETAVASSDSGCSHSEKACTGCKGHWCGVDEAPAEKVVADATTSGNATAGGNDTDTPATAATESATAEPGFCCYEGTTTDTCGSCLPTAQAKEDSYCAQPDKCGGCGGTWCAAKCVYSGMDPDDICSTAYSDAVAAATSSCAHSERLCIGCKGTWCPVSNGNGTALPVKKQTTTEEPDDDTEEDEEEEEPFKGQGLPGDFTLPQ